MAKKDLDNILPSEEPPACLYRRVLDDIPTAQGKGTSADLQGILPAQDTSDALLARVLADIPKAENQTADAEMLAILPSATPSKALRARVMDSIPELLDDTEESDFISSKWLKAGIAALGINVAVSSYAVADAYISNGMSLLANTLLMGIGG